MADAGPQEGRPYTVRTKAWHRGCKAKDKCSSGPALWRLLLPAVGALAQSPVQIYFFSMNSAPQPLPGVSWFDVSDPNSPELDELAQRLGFHELQVEDCRHRPQRAKMEEYDKYIFCVLKHLRNDADFTFEDFDLFLTANELVSVHEPNSD